MKYAIIIFCFIPAICLAQIDVLVSPGELSKAHEKFSGVKNCNVCHGADENVLESKCLECHKQLNQRIQEGKGFHANKKSECTTCHTEHLGKDYDIRQLNLKTFRHEETGYPLEGLHARIASCSACHKTRSFLGLSTGCASCHQDRHQGRLPNCESCHSVFQPMKQVKFDHSTTRFLLKGAHAGVTCARCHKNEVYKGLSFAECSSCHSDPHKGTLGRSCSRCHTEERWKQVSVEHRTFPLIGKHKTVSCNACHRGGQWKITAFSRCADCHKDPHLGQFAQTCESCHTVEGFKPAKFKHDRFPLEQRHNVACVKCHSLQKGKFPGGSGEAIRYRPISTDCIHCHKDVHAGQFGSKCESCHNTTTFRVKGFDHSRTKFPLDRDHINVACEKCHKVNPKTGSVVYKPLSTACESCHKDPHLGQLGSKCAKCHVPGQLLFNHSDTRFPLTGKHGEVPCEKCHKAETGKFPGGPGEAVRYTGMSMQCASCHIDYHRGQFKQDCSACHTTSGFKPSTFTHATSLFPLTGSHSELTCDKCHKMEKVSTPPPDVRLVRYSISRACQSCHEDPHQGKFEENCTKCHDTTEWKSVNRAFHKKGVFPLEGKHLDVGCEECHWEGVIQGTPTRCYDCHWIRRQDDIYQTRLGTDCERCHQPNSWSAVRFNHLAESGIAIGPSHQTLSCEECHLTRTFDTKAADCYTCHRDDYQRTSSPNHASLGFSTTCNECHSVSSGNWRTAFNHEQVFPLAGAHRTADCSQCHRNNVYAGTPKDCQGCHRNDYDQTKDPNHAAAGFPLQCDTCHKFADPDWHVPAFNHNPYYTLVGRHATAECSACHVNNIYKGTSTDCFGCHKNEYDRTANPNHRNAGFSTNCQSCHRPSDPSWIGAGFDHDLVYKLVGKHALADCSQCHKNNVFAGTPRDCYSCHKAEYNSTNNPKHSAAGFPITCEACHKPAASTWRGILFNHNQYFKLVGNHATASCSQCHLNNRYAGTPRDCYSCHKAEYNATTNPKHSAAGFPTTCDACHKASASSWLGAVFNHNQYFALVGRHATASCSQCHVNNRYAGTPRDCYSCHKTEYNNATNPNHISAGFPTTCDACHRAADSSWDQGVFSHTRFPINSGNHAGFNCVQCHPNTSNFQIFTCTTSCHPSSETNSEHQGVSGYAYQSSACYSCHPTGVE